jgi:hypothetical protein
MVSPQLPETAALWRVVSRSSADAFIPLTKERTVCGRNPNCDVVLVLPTGGGQCL